MTDNDVTSEPIPTAYGGSTEAGIPSSLRPFFQEYTLESLDPSLHAELIIERTLAHGNRLELRWLFVRYGRTRIAAWVRRSGRRRLPWRRYNLWCVLLGLPLTQHPHVEGRRAWPY